ncbi:MAG: hypothetical protein KDK99_16975 [Verrucomicrobiales bacterium]|nr:hypothetical protein [Verrucomicrobiales bacterium]
MKWLYSIVVLAGVPVMEGSAKDAYTGDVDFLLREFEARAGGLMAVKKIDWQAVSQEYRAAARETQTDVEHLKLVARLVGELRDGHAGIIKSTVKWPDESLGRRYTGPRVSLLAVRDRVLVRGAFKDAAAAGLHAGQEVLRMDGLPARQWLDERVRVMQERGQGFSTPQMALYMASHWGLADWAGTQIDFEIRDADGQVREIARVRNGGPNYAAIGPLFAPEDLQYVGRQAYGRTPEGLGYLHLRDVPANLPIQLQEMLAKIGDVPGMILDMRANGGGGCDHAAVFAKFLAKGQSWRGYTAAYDDGYTGPLVVIVDAGVRSAGETVAGMFKEDGRAYMIGESATAGMSSQKQEITTPSGWFTVRFSVASNMGRFNEGRGIEGIGVVPHETVLPDAKDLLEEKDTLIARAVQLLQQGFPEGVVAYPAKR